jgi:hypothetical protein
MLQRETTHGFVQRTRPKHREIKRFAVARSATDVDLERCEALPAPIKNL